LNTLIACMCWYLCNLKLYNVFITDSKAQKTDDADSQLKEAKVIFVVGE